MARKALLRIVMVSILWYLTLIVLELHLLIPDDKTTHKKKTTKKKKSNATINQNKQQKRNGHFLTNTVTYQEDDTPSSKSTQRSETHKHVVAPKESAGLSVGKVYSARPCHLEPGWGGGGNTTSKHCVGSRPTVRYTTAQHLTCDHEKPSLANRSHAGFTIALLYFAEPAMLYRQLEVFASYAPEIQQSMTVLIIDDGSPAGLRVTDYFDMSNYSAPFRIRLATIATERDWNIGGARNLAFYLSDTPKTLLLDLDILVPPPAIRKALKWPLVDTRTGKEVAHRFNRYRLDGTEKLHPAICVIGTNAYWENGGCDEDLCGHYGFTDRHFWYRWKADHKKKQVYHKDVYLREFQVASCDPNILGEEKATMCKKAYSHLKHPIRNADKNFLKPVALLTQRSSKLKSSYVMDHNDSTPDLCASSIISKNDHTSGTLQNQDDSSSSSDDQHLLENRHDCYKIMKYRQELLKDDLSMLQSQLSRSYQKGRSIARPLGRRSGNQDSSLPTAY